MGYQYDPFANDFVYVPDYPQADVYMPQQPGMGAKIGGAAASIAGTGAGVYGANALAEALGGAPAAATALHGGGTAAGISALAPSAANIGAASAPTASLGAASASAPAAAGTGTFGSLGSIAAPIAAVAGPLLAGKLIESTFFKQKPKRPYNPEEVVQDFQGPKPLYNTLSNQIKGWDKMGKDTRLKLVDALHGAQILGLRGEGKSVDGELQTANRLPEGIDWDRYLTNRSQPSARRFNRDYSSSQGNVFNPTIQPTENQISGALWLKKDKRNQLQDVLSQIKAAEKEVA